MNRAIAGIVTAVAAALTAATASAGTVEIGDLLLPFDSRVWHIQRDGEQMSLQQVDDRDGDLAITVKVEEGEAAACSQQAMSDLSAILSRPSWQAETFTVARDGFDLHVATVQLGCRNWTGSPVYACTFYRNRVYTFIADPGGCDTPPLYDEPVLEALGGLVRR